jgi:hypothetical protein
MMIRRSRLYVRMNQPTIAARLNLGRPSASCTVLVVLTMVVLARRR